nr:MBL fold metallo-hydrolase [uncultured Gemmiger sp.]
MTKITFYKGLRVIGGTFVAVETDRAVCMFDFGFTVNDRADESIRLRPGHIPQDYVRAGMLPCADGIYEPQTAADLGVVPYGETEKPHFFLLSHMHIDHMGGLDMLDPRIPVYMTDESETLYRRLAAQSKLTFREHPACIGVPGGQSFSVEDITVQVLPIDHDCVGACGFLIHTPDGSICYTGDYRFHGYHPDRTAAFAEVCRGADVLITEGVTVSFGDVDMLSLEAPDPKDRTEADLLAETADFCAQAPGMVVINPYNRNVERIHNLNLRLAQQNRRLVLDAVQADYLAAFYPEDPLYVYAETVFEHAVPERAVLIGRDDLLRRPRIYVLQLDYRDFYELFDLRPAVSGYLHMDGAPLGAYDPSYQKMLLQLQNLGIPFHNLGLGGHARPYYLKQMVDTIAPKTLVPLHSQRPEQVNSRCIGQRILPEEGQTIVLEQGEVKA